MNTQSLIPAITSSAQTRLDPVISGLGWNNGFEIGAGLNAVTGSLGANAIKPAELIDAKNKSSTTRYRFIKSESELQQEISASAKGSYNMEGVTLSASSSFVTQVKLSELYVSLVAQFESSYSEYDEAETYELTEEAGKLITDRDKFRATYGDYFVAGRKRGSSFNAVYTCHATSVESMNKFMASFGADAPDVFSVEGSVAFERAAKEADMEVDVWVEMVGYVGTPPVGPWTPESVLGALQWFTEHETGIPVQAKLFHFSTLDPNFSPEVPIDPAVFAELSVLYMKRWEILDGFNSIPDVYQKQFEEDVTRFNSDVMASTGTLPTDAEIRATLAKQATVLLADLNDVLARQDFYFKVKEKQKGEPAKDHIIDEGKGVQVWLYGFSKYPQSEAVNIQSSSQHYSEKWHIGFREHTFVFEPDQSRLIVGWEVHSNWQDGSNGSWYKASDQIILESGAQVHVKSEYDRGCNWTVDIYYVDAANYQF
ncbi:hypothetical protein KQ940_08820 [Marinobacterium sp. D7]|uniref:hypothetical protein n=1 Tax=Marinobacterium ramblicola TaxID=2849041 RepID=UPI001C2D55D3|nr:hypothetical protein [Marinobacterium ramblicola]MBV1788157.1 hypothetical protein [Marinobacterium ramblicola]